MGGREGKERVRNKIVKKRNSQGVVNKVVTHSSSHSLTGIVTERMANNPDIFLLPNINLAVVVIIPNMTK